LLQLAFSSPIVVSDPRQFFAVAGMARAKTFLLYCNPEDTKVLDSVLRAAVAAKKSFPTAIQTGPDGDFEINKDEEVLFVVSTTPNLMFFQFDEAHEGPQALLTPFGEETNSMETMLPKLRKLDGLPLTEWFEKASNSEAEFAPKAGDSASERNQKESLQGWYSGQRFIWEKRWLTSDAAVLTDGQKMQEYIRSALAGKVGLHFRSAAIPKSDGGLKRLCASDYHDFVARSNLGKSKLVLITHADEAKNRGIEQQFSRFAQNEEKLLSSKSKPTIPIVYGGRNESEAFITPAKLPTVLLYKRGAPLTEGPVELDRLELLKAFRSSSLPVDEQIDEKAFDKVLKDFMKKN